MKPLLIWAGITSVGAITYMAAMLVRPTFDGFSLLLMLVTLGGVAMTLQAQARIEAGAK